MDSTGAYSADRASALSGVPKSTIHYWARTELLVPSVSTEKVKLWSYPDLMGLRTIYWLRQHKTNEAGARVPPTSMKAIRRALRQLGAVGEPIWHSGETSIWVAPNGEIHVRGPAGPETLSGQTLVPDALNLIAPFPSREGLRGPDLARPRPGLRIAPGRLSGSPHVAHTRLETSALYALERDGLGPDMILSFYPYLAKEQLAEALDLERQLADNLAIPSAA